MTGIKLKRKMYDYEISCARAVFAGSLPYDRIRISNTLGAGKRPYTTPELKHNGGWILHVGEVYYANLCIWNGPSLLVHELVHVWQSYHSPIRWGYVADSMCQQGLLFKGKRAYKYTLGKNWSEYHTEQQAQLVEDWYWKGEMKETDKRFPYIRDHIRRGIN